MIFLGLHAIFFGCTPSKNQSEVKEILYSSGEIKAQITMRDSTRHGVMKYFYKNGQIKHISHWVNGIQKIKTTEYSKDGQPINYKINYCGDSVAYNYSDYEVMATISPKISNLKAYFLCELDKNDSLEFIQIKQAVGNPKYPSNSCKYKIIVQNDTARCFFTVKNKAVVDLVLIKDLELGVKRFFEYHIKIPVVNNK
jgi:antitoxin component YwqK of YwqJK toxin-antitoxin module